MAAKAAMYSQDDFRPKKKEMLELDHEKAKDYLDPILFDLLEYSDAYGSETRVHKIIANAVCKAHFDLQYVVDPNRKDKDGNPAELWTDKAGNLFVTVGASKILFSSHTDNVAEGGIKQKLFVDHKCYVYAFDEEGNERAIGADDKIGVWIMIKMIQKGIPGNYVFHAGEEVGGKGSSYILENSEEWLRTMDMAIAFDREGYTDVITHQMGGMRTASNKFAEALSEKLNTHLAGIDTKDISEKDLLRFKPGITEQLKFSKDDGGFFTDTATYCDVIPECTNISVGYFGRHSIKECFDNWWLEGYFLPTILAIDWENLPVHRDPNNSIPAPEYKRGKVLNFPGHAPSSSYVPPKKKGQTSYRADAGPNDDIPFDLSPGGDVDPKLKGQIPGKLAPHEVTYTTPLSMVPDMRLPLSAEIKNNRIEVLHGLNFKLVERALQFTTKGGKKPTLNLIKQIGEIQEANARNKILNKALMNKLDIARQGNAPQELINKLAELERVDEELKDYKKRCEDLEHTLALQDTVQIPELEDQIAALKKLKPSERLEDNVKRLPSVLTKDPTVVILRQPRPPRNVNDLSALYTEHYKLIKTHFPNMGK